MPDSDQVALVAVFGPTGVGKTACAVELARRFAGEVVNADSRYLYRHLNIGVAKPTQEERRGIPHHLIDVFDPRDVITIAEVQRLALAAINDIAARGRLPILVGGTPLYMNAIVEGWQIPEVPPDWDFRNQLAARIERDGLESVASELAQVDPETFARSRQNPRRVVRALEIFHVTGVPMSVLATKESPPYRILKIALTRDRAELYRILDRRVDEQIASGLLNEVRGLLAMGLSGDEPAFSAIGYRQLVPVVSGERDLETAITRIKQATHRYVRHQMTWLRRTPDLHWVDTGEVNWQSRVDSLVSLHCSIAGTTEP